ncbi:MAG: ribonuclease III [Rhodospirillales bacterium]|jgi:ribonuclease III|nr:ribonuclease III [Rhodospirillales bacterium]MBT4041673.1 ribonuclease III [Rhodospirillales bacterium]MBT4626377.1 ribonuclease III [Rhodospirillales bacterium]MBT5350135.1 ribonuclease III [Rhodospirillales bacterium]MBT5521001.1 ribonuclease III [Rhodospirillales bacterium]
MTDSLQTLQTRIGYQFNDVDLLNLSLTHASRTLARDRTSSNERLEFLGDRVLGLVVAAMLYERFPNEEEGALSRRFTALVRKESLARVATDLNIHEDIILSRAENDTGGRDNPAIMADACEAIIGAMFLDGGYDAAQSFIKINWEPLLEEDLTPPKDAKTALQEWSQGRDLGLPEYKVVETSGPSHAPNFHISAIVEGMPVQIAEGTSKRKAEQAAARLVLDHIDGASFDGTEEE